MSSLIRELLKTDDVETVKSVQFSLMSPEMIEKGSVCEITVPDTYSTTNGEPVINGLFDPRMGVIDSNSYCPTCEQDSDLCPNHFGHIKLAIPVYYLHHIKEVLKILRCICLNCSNLLINKSDPYVLEAIRKKHGKKRFDIINELSKKTKDKKRICKYNDGCGAIQPEKISKVLNDNIKDKSNIIKLVAHYSSDALKDASIDPNIDIDPTRCYNIFRMLTDDNIRFLGFSPEYSKPEWMICTVLPVPPPAVRPSVRQDNNQRSEDDLTYSLMNIVKYNRDLKNKMSADSSKKDIDNQRSLLQYYVATLIDNDNPNIPQSKHRSGRPLKALFQRIKAKEGRIRGNIMGKRVDYSARTVISCGPELSIDEFGVPLKIAMNMTTPEIVTKYNIKKMRKLVDNGPDKYPGAKSVTKNKFDCFGVPSPCTISLKYKKPELNIGDVVNRHLQNGDIGFFNRQPTLHRLSMLAMKIVVVPHDTFRLNVFNTTGFNADFDSFCRKQGDALSGC